MRPLLLLLVLWCSATQSKWSLLGKPAPATGPIPRIDPLSEDDVPAGLYRFVNRSGVAAEGTFFLSVGDWGRRNPSSAQVALQMRRWARVHPPAFVISTGDNFYETGLRSANDPRFTTVWRELFFQEGLQTRWYSSLGQHDLRGNASAQVLLTNRSGSGWFLPSPYYASRRLTVDSSGTTAQLFVFNPYGSDFKSVQLPWLRAALNDSAADWKLLVAHRPAFTSGGACVPHREEAEYRDRIHDLMRRYGAQAHFSGDNHFLEVLDVGGHSFFLSGGGCGSLTYIPAPRSPHSVVAAPVCGFMAHHLSSEVLHTTVVDSDGRELLHHTVSRHATRACPVGSPCHHPALPPTHRKVHCHK
eukprot:EG_transcript_17859